ncbi:MAG: hypothetical protein ABSE77_14965 [Acidimicrobiales bacterium]
MGTATTTTVKASRSQGLTTIVGVQDYAGAWSDERARCHRLVYDPGGKPTGCPAPPVASGWRRDYQGRWYAVDACAHHGPQLQGRPRPRWGRHGIDAIPWF